MTAPPPLWNFSKNSSDLIAGPFPKLSAKDEKLMLMIVDQDDGGDDGDDDGDDDDDDDVTDCHDQGQGAPLIN